MTQPASVAMRHFVETLCLEIGQDAYSTVLSKAGLAEAWAQADHFYGWDSARASQAYARLQAALRTYYGRGARGILLRIGAKLWGKFLAGASLRIKIWAALIRMMPKTLRRRLALELLMQMVDAGNGQFTLHSLDLDLLLVDHASPSTQGQSSDTAICFVTLGLIQECLYWTVGETYDIEERACRATGARQCEFKITSGV